MLVLLHTVNNKRLQQKLRFLYYVKKYFGIKERSHQKLMTLLIIQVLFSFEMRKYASFAEINMIFTTVTKAQLVR